MGGHHGRQAIHFDFDAMTTAFPLEDVKRVLAETGRLSQRERKLPAPTMVYLIIALGLMTSTGAKEVLRRVLDRVRERERPGWVEPASEAAICKARKRLGYEPLKELFEQVSRPIATRRTRGAWFRGRRLVTVDGSSLQVQDSSANARAFGRPKTAHRPAAYPVIRFVMLIENGTRVPFAAAMDRWRRSETALARRVIDRLGKGMLCLADRLFYSYDLWTEAVATGADLLWRVPSYVTLPRLQELPDRSYLSELHSGKKGAAARSAPRIPVRVIEYTIKVGGKLEHYRMVTTLLSVRSATAMELARLYERRWNIESSLQEIKTWLRGRRVLLRSRLPELVKQDFYGLLLAYFGVRCLIHEGALQKNIEPTSVSFLHALNVVIQRLPQAVAFSPSGHAALP
jgi:Insertion element 4 transposase N-terminal/Transposase DDE domain